MKGNPWKAKYDVEIVINVIPHYQNNEILQHTLGAGLVAHGYQGSAMFMNFTG